MPIAVATYLQAAPLPRAPVGPTAVERDFEGGRFSSEAGRVLRKDSAAPRIPLTPEDVRQQRVLHMAAGADDANDAHMLRDEPICALRRDRLPETGARLASHRRAHGGKTASPAPHSPAGRWCCWSKVAPPLPQSPQSACATSMMVAIVVGLCTAMRALPGACSRPVAKRHAAGVRSGARCCRGCAPPAARLA
jgi:hypothetical protein